MYKIQFIIIFFIFPFLYSQTTYSSKQIDSLLISTEKPNNWDLKKNIDFLNNIYRESEKINYEKGMYSALTKISDWYMLKAQYKNAIPYFEKIENLQIKNPDNIKYKIYTLQSKAFAFTNLGLYDDAQVAIGKSMSLAYRVNDNDKKFQFLGKAFDLKAAIYIELKMPEDSVLLYLKKSAVQYQQLKNSPERTNLLNSAYINISTSFFEAKKLDSAMLYSQKVIKSKQINDEVKNSVFQTLAQIHREKNNLDSAFYYYKNAEAISAKLGNPIDLKSIYQALTEMYDKSGDKENALIYAKKYSHLSDSLNAINKQSAVIANKNIKEDLREENASQQKHLYWVIGAIIAILVFLSLLSLYIFRNYTKEKKSRQEEKTIIEEKTKELEQLQSKVNDSFDEILSLAKNNSPAFLSRFREVYPGFCEKIIHLCPDVHNSELTFCAFIKLNLSTKEIANYTFTSVKTVQNRKTRLRKRLNIPSNDDLYVWINNL